MTFDCSSYCYETSFLVALSRFNLSKGAHSSSENALESFIACFSRLIPDEDLWRRIDLLYQRSAQNPYGSNDLYSSGLELEYGQHVNLLTNSSCPNVSLISSFSRIFDLEIYIVCGNSPLRFLRIDGNNGEFNVLKFNFCRTQSPRRIVVGMLALGIFHAINQPAADNPIWQTLSRKAILVNPEIISINDQLSDDDSDDDHGRIIDDELASNTNNRLETAWDVNEEVPTNGPLPETVSIQTFLNRFVSHDSNGSNLNSEAYNCPVKLDVGLTSREDLRENELTRLEQVIDVDGFYGAYPWKSNSVFKGHVEILPNPLIATEKETNSCIKLLKDFHFHSDDKLVLSKVAICKTNFGIIDLFYAGFINRNGLNVNDATLFDLIKEAYADAKIAKCRNDSTGEITHEGCRSATFRDNTDAYRPISGISNQQIYDRYRYECFTFHFEQSLLAKLTEIGLHLTSQMCYTQVVGMKFVLLSPTINGVMTSVNAIGEFFDLNIMHSCFDICFSTIGHCSDPDKAVRILCFK